MGKARLPTILVLASGLLHARRTLGHRANTFHARTRLQTANTWHAMVGMVSNRFERWEALARQVVRASGCNTETRNGNAKRLACALEREHLQ